ncbi:MAG: anti-sigma factor [Candidatus Eremiobacteraeota bacterium]|nr:anti-sigma factor [Candidatus Eremiobacteraeota bacterium]
MSETSHVTDSAGPYVLGAVSDEEARRIEAHARECAACREDIRQLRDVSGVLPLASPQMDAPAGLKAKILAAAQSDAPARDVLRRAAERAMRTSPRQGFWRREVPAWAGLAGWMGVATACAIMGIFIGMSGEREHMLALQQRQGAVVASDAFGRQKTSGRVTAPLAAPAGDAVYSVSADQLQAAMTLIGQSQVFDLSVRHSGDHIPAKIVQMPNEDHAMLVSDMPAPPSGDVYRVWLIRKGHLHPVGVVQPGKMRKTMIRMKVQMGDVIAFSMAPAEDSALPAHFMMQQTL